MSANPSAPLAPIVVVSGLPRSGTSLVMAMLAAGGVPAHTDGQRQADADNPNGYWELEAVKRLAADATFLVAAAGRAIKIVVPLVRHLPTDARFCFRVVLLERDLEEVLASQATMIRRKGLQPALPAAQLKPALARQWDASRLALAERADVHLLVLSHRRILADPAGAAVELASLVTMPLDTEAMARVVDPRLYRQRA